VNFFVFFGTFFCTKESFSSGAMSEQQQTSSSSSSKGDQPNPSSIDQKAVQDPIGTKDCLLVVFVR